MYLIKEKKKKVKSDKMMMARMMEDEEDIHVSYVMMIVNSIMVITVSIIGQVSLKYLSSERIVLHVLLSFHFPERRKTTTGNFISN